MGRAVIGQILPAGAPQPSPALWDFLLVGGVTLALATVIFVTVAVTRRGRKRRTHSRGKPEILRNTEEHLREEDELVRSAEETDRRPGHRRKRRRRDHRPRNPTLAESGGLPPERDANTAPHTGL